jgi:cell division septum initiation protein DivIVA
VNDYGKPQNDKTQQDDQTQELIDQLNLLEDVDRHITPEHVAQRFRELLDAIGDGGPPSPAPDQTPRGIPGQPGCDPRPTGPWRRYDAEPWTDPFGLTGSLEAAVAAARSAAAEIIADAELKTKTAKDELRHAQEAAAVARQQAEQFVADARAEADNALERAIKMIRDAGDQAKQILSDARDEAEQIVTAARNQQVHQAGWTGHQLKVYRDAPEVSQPTLGPTYLHSDQPKFHPLEQALADLLATWTLPSDQCWTSYARTEFHPILADGMTASAAAQSRKRLRTWALLRAAEQLAEPSTDDATSMHWGQQALYQAATYDHGVYGAIHAGRTAASIRRNRGIRAWAPYQDTWLVGFGSVGSAAWCWKLDDVPSDLYTLLARYGEVNERALADTIVRVWRAIGTAAPQVLASHSEPIYTVTVSLDGRSTISGGADGTVQVWDQATEYRDLYTLLAKYLGRTGQDVPVDAAGDEGDISSEQAEAADCSHAP